MIVLKNYMHQMHLFSIAAKTGIMITMTEDAIKQEIAELKTKLTGNLFEDGETMQAIYELKKHLNPAIEFNPSAEEDEDGCLYCGS